MKNPRRVADTQKILGAAGGLSVLLAPVLAQHYSSFWDLVKACGIVVIGAFLTFLCGLGTRGPGMEYTEVTEAKVRASMLPPAPSIVPSANVAPEPPEAE
jgi:hypothetical protein